MKCLMGTLVLILWLANPCLATAKNSSGRKIQGTSKKVILKPFDLLFYRFLTVLNSLIRCNRTRKPIKIRLPKEPPGKVHF